MLARTCRWKRFHSPSVFVTLLVLGSLVLSSKPHTLTNDLIYAVCVDAHIHTHMHGLGAAEFFPAFYFFLSGLLKDENHRLRLKTVVIQPDFEYAKSLLWIEA